MFNYMFSEKEKKIMKKMFNKPRIERKKTKECCEL
jgi:hypothetical protein